MKLSSPLTIGGDVQTISLPVSGSIPSGDTDISGWGSTSTSSTPEMPDSLQTAVLPLITIDGILPYFFF